MGRQKFDGVGYRFESQLIGDELKRECSVSGVGRSGSVANGAYLIRRVRFRHYHQALRSFSGYEVIHDVCSHIRRIHVQLKHGTVIAH